MRTTCAAPWRRCCARPVPLHKNGTASRRGRYGAGKVDGKDIPAYLDEPGVEASRHTETWAEMTVVIDNWRWAGVPFVLSSGKAMGDACQDILVTFKDVPHLPGGLTGVTGPSQLRISLETPAPGPRPDDQRRRESVRAGAG